MASCSPVIVAAIDIGTTYSGYAFSFKHKKHAITTNKIWKGSTEVSYKTPTVVLVDNDGGFISFGYEAEAKYAELERRNEHRDVFYFKRFKMRLYNQQCINRDLEITDIAERTMRALDVFALTIKYFKDHLLFVLNGSGRTVQLSDIQFVLTVPALWDESAKQFMREAANLAGIADDHIMISLEPETASIYCRAQAARALPGNVDISSAGACYLVVDAGGGTVDITAHRVASEDRLVELCRAGGGDWGGTAVDEEFLELMMKLYTSSVITLLRNDHPTDRLDIERDFEIHKRRISPTTEHIFIRIPASLQSIFDDFGLTLEEAGFGDQVGMQGDKLKLSRDLVLPLFAATTDKIIDHVREVLELEECSDVKTILMVGGFSESPLLRQRMVDSFDGYTVVRPRDADLAVMQGAVIFGHDPGIIQTRLSTYTYGIGTVNKFLEEEHNPDYYKEIDGVAYCQHMFDRFISINEATYFGKLSPAKKYSPLYTGQTGMSLKVYRSTTVSPKYTTDPSCTHVGELNVSMPDLTGEKNRRVSVQIIFEGTEMTVKALDVTSGGKFETKLDFLSKKLPEG